MPPAQAEARLSAADMRGRGGFCFRFLYIIKGRAYAGYNTVKNIFIHYSYKRRSGAK